MCKRMTDRKQDEMWTKVREAMRANLRGPLSRDLRKMVEVCRFLATLDEDPSYWGRYADGLEDCADELARQGL